MWASVSCTGGEGLTAPSVPGAWAHTRHALIVHYLPLSLSFSLASSLAPALPLASHLFSPLSLSLSYLLSPSRYNDPILNEGAPDPVFDDEFEYLGTSKLGFVTFAEKLNGRAAMMGFTIAFLQELVIGKGVLEQWGLPYDAGAVLMQ